MKSVTIDLKLAENVKAFVEISSRYSFDMDLRNGRYVVDAKSILGIFSLELNKPVVLEIFSNDCDSLINELKPFII